MAENSFLADNNKACENPNLLLHSIHVDYLCDIW
jgi:hypothetical protein